MGRERRGDVERRGPKSGLPGARAGSRQAWLSDSRLSKDDVCAAIEHLWVE